MVFKLFAILQKYDFSSKSQRLRPYLIHYIVVCDTAKVRFFKQITTATFFIMSKLGLFAILQKYDFSSKSQHYKCSRPFHIVVCDTAKVRFFKQITTELRLPACYSRLFAILQKYDFSSKSQQIGHCLVTFLLFAILQKYDFSSKSQRKNKSTKAAKVVCDTAKVRFFKQITTMV